MRLDRVIELLDIKEGIDGDGFPQKTVFIRKTVFAKKDNVRSTEFYNATQSGFSREKIMLIILAMEYESQRFLEYNSKRYEIIRTYENGKFLEMFCHAYQERP